MFGFNYFLMNKVDPFNLLNLILFQKTFLNNLMKIHSIFIARLKKTKFTFCLSFKDDFLIISFSKLKKQPIVNLESA